MRKTLLLLAGVVIVSAGGLFAREGLNAGADGYILALWRLTIAAGVLLPLLIRGHGRGVRLGRADQLCLAAAGVFMAVHFATWLTSMRFISVARSTLLVSTSPLWAGIAGFFLPGRRPGWRLWLGLALAATGVGFFTSPSLELPSDRLLGPAWVGDLYALAGAIAIVPYFLLSQTVQARLGTWETVGRIYVAGAVSLWILAIPLGEARLPGSPYVWVAVLGMAAFSQLLGHTALNGALRQFSAGQVTTATLLEPVFAGAMAWVLFGERLGGWQIGGGAILLAGVALALRDGRPGHDPAAGECE